ncbi:hypothetical protein H9P43_006441 [Blastocladiella emersonii ATCC 22665]|nr:hypothetical protein H9P43_006441 [Blastocladiella emersonii ATCC 22665]
MGLRQSSIPDDGSASRVALARLVRALEDELTPRHVAHLRHTFEDLCDAVLESPATAASASIPRAPLMRSIAAHLSDPHATHLYGLIASYHCVSAAPHHRSSLPAVVNGSSTSSPMRLASLPLRATVTNPRRALQRHVRSASGPAHAHARSADGGAKAGAHQGKQQQHRSGASSAPPIGAAANRHGARGESDTPTVTYLTLLACVTHVVAGAHVPGLPLHVASGHRASYSPAPSESPSPPPPASSSPWKSNSPSSRGSAPVPIDLHALSDQQQQTLRARFAQTTQLVLATRPSPVPGTSPRFLLPGGTHPPLSAIPCTVDDLAHVLHLVAALWTGAQSLHHAAAYRSQAQQQPHGGGGARTTASRTLRSVRPSSVFSSSTDGGASHGGVLGDQASSTMMQDMDMRTLRGAHERDGRASLVPLRSAASIDDGRSLSLSIATVGAASGRTADDAALNAAETATIASSTLSAGGGGGGPRGGAATAPASPNLPHAAGPLHPAHPHHAHHPPLPPHHHHPHHHDAGSTAPSDALSRRSRRAGSMTSTTAVYHLRIDPETDAASHMSRGGGALGDRERDRDRDRDRWSIRTTPASVASPGYVAASRHRGNGTHAALGEPAASPSSAAIQALAERMWSLAAGSTASGATIGHATPPGAPPLATDWDAVARVLAAQLPAMWRVSLGAFLHAAFLGPATSPPASGISTNASAWPAPVDEEDPVSLSSPWLPASPTASTLQFSGGHSRAQPAPSSTAPAAAGPGYALVNDPDTAWILHMALGVAPPATARSSATTSSVFRATAHGWSESALVDRLTAAAAGTMGEAAVALVSLAMPVLGATIPETLVLAVPLAQSGGTWAAAGRAVAVAPAADVQHVRSTGSAAGSGLVSVPGVLAVPPTLHQAVVTLASGTSAAAAAGLALPIDAVAVAAGAGTVTLPVLEVEVLLVANGGGGVGAGAGN